MLLSRGLGLKLKALLTLLSRGLGLRLRVSLLPGLKPVRQCRARVPSVGVRSGLGTGAAELGAAAIPLNIIQTALFLQAALLLLKQSTPEPPLARALATRASLLVDARFPSVGTTNLIN